MPTEKELKAIVQDRYSKIATQDKTTNASSCCGATTPSNKVYNIMMDDYSEVDGYIEEADLGLGCGLPVAFAKINVGDTVIDLGSGAGNDCFVARHEVGPSGKVLGIDFTPAMIRQARINSNRLGYNNVEFRHGDIDDMPVEANVADVVVSNCVLNLVPDKSKVISEIFRVLKPGGHFSISDIVLEGQLPAALKADAELYAGCVAGAIQKDDYLGKVQEAGFEQVTVQKVKVITLPEDILERYLDSEGIKDFQSGKTGIFSITVYGQKPSTASTDDSKSMMQLPIMDTSGSCC